MRSKNLTIVKYPIFLSFKYSQLQFATINTQIKLNEPYLNLESSQRSVEYGRFSHLYERETFNFTLNRFFVYSSQK